MASGFRVATEDDIDSILPMMRAYYAEDDYPFDPAAARHAALELIRRDELGRLWVATADGAVVGYLAVTLGFQLRVPRTRCFHR